VLQEDITKVDFDPIIRGSRRAVVFWDAHGAEVADAVITRLLPALPAENMIVVDDMWTTPDRYGLRAVHQAGPLWSLFDELPPLWSYLEERGVELNAGERWITFMAPD
jgi:hypothetical protein